MKTHYLALWRMRYICAAARELGESVSLDDAPLVAMTTDSPLSAGYLDLLP